MPKALPVIDMSTPVCCPPVAAGPVDDAAALEVALRLKAIADPVRVKLMSLLLTSPLGEQNSGDLATAVGLSESTVSHHLSQLRTAGLIESERRGMNTYTAPAATHYPPCVSSWTPTAAADLRQPCIRSEPTSRNWAPRNKSSAPVNSALFCN